MNLNKAFDLILKGHSLSQAARELDIPRQKLSKALNKYQPYTDYRESTRADYENKRQQALRLAREGFACFLISQKLGLNQSTVFGWLSDESINTGRTGKEVFLCPACGDSMTRQDFFFYICNSCKSEWWPSEDSLPEDVDDWTRPWRVVNDTGDAALSLMKRLREDGKQLKEISIELNEQQLLSPTGRPWTAKLLQKYMSRRGLLGTYKEDRTEIDRIITDLAGRYGVKLQFIADRLNEKGFKTVRQRDWTADAVQKVIRDRIEPDAGKLKLRGNFGVYVKCRSQGLSKGQHPWRIAENARIKLGKEAFESKKTPGG